MITDLIKDFKQVNRELKLTKKFPLYSQDDLGEDAQVLLLYVIPDSNTFWAVTEVGTGLTGDDITFFGLVNIQECELGYFTLNELAQFNREHDYPKIERVDIVCTLTIAGLKEMLNVSEF